MVSDAACIEEVTRWYNQSTQIRKFCPLSHPVSSREIYGQQQRVRSARENFLSIFAFLLQKNGIITLLLAKYALFSHTILLKVF